MKLAVVGTGYVGLVTGTCFAEAGHSVTCMDIDRRKVERLRRAEIPIFEPGLEALVQRNVAAGRLRFTSDHAEAVRGADFVFLAVGTPSAPDGSANLQALWDVARDLGPVLPHETLVVVKSTVPAGTNAELARRLRAASGRDCAVASNPEFLREGVAIRDFQEPDRVVVGTRNDADAERLRALYAPLLASPEQFLVMSPESAEVTKYAANAMLAARISFINEIANLCESVQADVGHVRRGIGSDPRIGPAFLQPGAGYGGSCFPKDVRALQAMFRACGLESHLLEAVERANKHQKTVLAQKVVEHFGVDLRGVTLAVWGLAFKPETDDIREASALVFLADAHERGAALRVYDPQAMEHVRAQWEDNLHYAADPYAALDGADALVILTEWRVFQQADLAQVRRRLKTPLVFDGRNLFDPQAMRAAGFRYASIGRVTVDGRG